MYGVARKRADILKMSLVTSAAMLAICLLALVETTNTAEAKDSLTENGKIVFTRNGAIYTVEPDGSNLSQLTDGTPPGDRPVWSPDGTKIAFSQIREGQAVSGISVMSADGSNLRDNHMSKGTSGSLTPAWLPDGTKVAFNGRNADVYMMDPDGTNLINLTKTWSYGEFDRSGYIGYLQPAFSPNGSQMCFSQGRGLYVINVDGSDPTLLAKGAQEPPEGCNWSPDGTRIAFSISEVYVINADGSARTALTSGYKSAREPDWSPDGRRITFTSARDGDFDIYTMDTDGSDVAQVTNAPGHDFSPDWQPLADASGVLAEASQHNKQKLSGTNGRDNLRGGDGDEVIRGLGGPDDILHGSGDDVVYGGDDDDFVFPDSGNDVIYGGAGNDKLDSHDDGGDKLYCGEGRDSYWADKNDYVDSSCETNSAAGPHQTGYTGHDDLSLTSSASASSTPIPLGGTGGPAILLPAAVLLLGSGILTYAILRRR